MPELARNIAAAQRAEINVVPVSGRIGAEISGVALSGNLDQSTIAAIRSALLQHKVIFFRDQGHLDDAGHEAFARTLGTPVSHPTLPGDGSDFFLELDSHRGGKANSWHTDVTFVPDYPSASILRTLIVPNAGGDTVWANCVTAYQRLPRSLRILADTLWAVHSNDYDYAANQEEPDEELDAYQERFTSRILETEHPLVRVHPETGERALILGSFFKRFTDHSQDESRRLFDLFQSHITRLENTVRWRWQPGDVAVWENRMTQHYALDDYEGAHRVVRRMALAGDVPRSVDGRSSHQVTTGTSSG